MLNIPLLQNGKVMRYRPVAAGSTVHVPLSIVDELQPGTEVCIAVAVEGGAGTLILDIGILEVNTS